MARTYRKKPVTVEAVQWTGENHAEMCEFIDPEVFEIIPRVGLVIHTLEGDHHASPGDYIIKGVNGEFYPCKPDIFAKTYASAALTPPNEWVSVEERLPPEHEPVLCIVYGKPKPNIALEDAYQIGSWNKADGWIIDEYLDWEDADVSWWMSLPAPPDKDNNVPTKEQNEPLTLDELLKMDGEPVWVVPIGKCKWATRQWCVLAADEVLIPGVDHWWWSFEDYGETWIAYRRPPEGEEDA